MHTISFTTHCVSQLTFVISVQKLKKKRKTKHLKRNKYNFQILFFEQLCMAYHNFQTKSILFVVVLYVRGKFLRMK